MLLKEYRICMPLTVDEIIRPLSLAWNRLPGAEIAGLRIAGSPLALVNVRGLYNTAIRYVSGFSWVKIL
ncbi:hypothetical protein STEG23_011936 [Scotinomys teguina]